MKKAFYCLGLMSGSSLDGLDIAFCKISPKENDFLDIELIDSKTISFPEFLFIRLANIRTLSVIDITQLDIDLALFFCENIKKYFSSYLSSCNLIINHGHTLLHFPDKKQTKQIANSQLIASELNINVLGKLRQRDVMFGGQGAPLVPIYDTYVLDSYKYCLNLGGIMNISIKQSTKIIAFDIGFCNQILNILSQKLGFNYDKDGKLAASGHFHDVLFQSLNSLPFFSLPIPKSLDNEVKHEFLNILDSYDISIEDKLNTFCHHIVYQIAKTCSNTTSEIYTSGGGAHNKFLIDLLKSKYQLPIYLDIEKHIDFKEAMALCVFGYRYTIEKFNFFKSVTGAKKNTISGVLFTP